MSKKRYLSELKKHLQPLPQEQRKTVLMEIEGLIAESQVSDQGLIERFGTPSELASHYLEDTHIQTKPSLIYRFTNFFAWFIGGLFLIMVLGGVFVYFMYMGDRFDYSDESSARLNRDHSDWQNLPLDSPASLTISQSEVVVYWTDNSIIAFNCKRGLQQDRQGEKTNFAINQDQCLVYLPMHHHQIQSRQAKLVLVRPQSKLTLDMEQTGLRIADNGAKFSLSINGEENHISKIPTQLDAELSITVQARQSSITPYEF